MGLLGPFSAKIRRNPYGSTRLAWGVLGVAMIFWDLVATWTGQNQADLATG